MPTVLAAIQREFDRLDAAELPLPSAVILRDATRRRLLAEMGPAAYLTARGGITGFWTDVEFFGESAKDRITDAVSWEHL